MLYMASPEHRIHFLSGPSAEHEQWTMDGNAFLDFGLFPSHTPSAIILYGLHPGLGILLALAAAIWIQRAICEGASFHFLEAPPGAIQAALADRLAAIQGDGL